MLEFLSNLYNFIFPEHNGIIYAIDPLTIGLIAGGAQALIGGIGSIGARSRLRSLEGQEPKYEIPEQVGLFRQRAEEMAQTGMPEASRMMALQGAQQSALFGMRAAQDRRGGLASLGNIQAGLDRANLSVAAQDASMRLQNQRFAQQALMTQAQYKDKAFANQWQSWMNKFQQARANVGAKERIMYNGFDTMFSMAAMGALGGLGKTPKDVNLGSTLTPATTTAPAQQLQFAAAPTFDATSLPTMGGTLPGSQTLTPPPFPYYGTGNLQSQAIFNSLISRPNR